MIGNEIARLGERAVALCAFDKLQFQNVFQLGDMF